MYSEIKKIFFLHYDLSILSASVEFANIFMLFFILYSIKIITIFFTNLNIKL